MISISNRLSVLLGSLIASLALCGMPAYCASPGVVASQPEQGHFVEADGKYLVPYHVTIPGTNVSFEIIPVPAGTYTIGSPEEESDRNEDEGPQREVIVSPFWIGKCEVTWAEYRNYMRLCMTFEKFDDLGIRKITQANQIDAITAPSKLYDPSFTFASGDAPELPAVSMSQYSAKQYTKWLSLLTNDFFRLPTEAEWEYACRAGTKSAYSFGEDADDIEKYAWTYKNTDEVTQPVGSKLPNAWGLHDMHGNAAEWTLDGYVAEAYTNLPTDVPSPSTSFHRPVKQYPRVIRGGSCLSEIEECRSASRLASDADELMSCDPNTPKSPWWLASDESLAIGFRIIRPWPPVERQERNQYWDADVSRIQDIADYRIDEEGKGERGVVDPTLPEAIVELRTKHAK